MKKKLLHIILIMLPALVGVNHSFSQTPQLNEEKYWDYRDRLRQEFMTGIGPEMGMSIPASVRDTVNGILQWTDCTMAHGEYIGILGMEYLLLDDRSASTEATVEELFYALYALNRLDLTAEVFFDGTESLNGFFIRDDISEDSLDMEEVLEHLNQGLAVPRINGLDSDFMDEIPRNNEESLDQAILLLTGLAIVRACVPEDVEHYIDDEVQLFQDFESSLHTEAGNIIRRIVNYMKEGDSTTVSLDPGDPNLLGIEGLNWDFIIKNPVTIQEVLRGGNAVFLSKGFTGAKYHALGEGSPTTDTLMNNLTDSIFLSFENNIVGNDQDFKVINLNAMANFWPEGLQPDTAFADHNARNLGPRSYTQGYEWIPMLHQLLFGVEKNYLMSQVPPDSSYYNDPKGYYENLLNLAPPEGPYNYGNGNYPNWEWSSTSRTIQPGRRGELTTAFTGNYDGLDYMLYYNLYRVLFDESTGTTLKPEAQDARIFPNPVHGQLNIAGLPYDASYQLVDMQGRAVCSGSLKQGDNTIDTETLEPGFYILNIFKYKHPVLMYKIIKQNNF